MSKDTVTIDGVEYHKRDTGGERLRIMIVDNRGLTFVGMCEDPATAEGDWLTIRDARCVVRWGTTGHIAQLATSGPNSNTKLGMAHDVKVCVSSIVLCYDCDGEWNNG